MVALGHLTGEEIMFYEYYQNNSGGTYRGPARMVCVEASNPQEADRRAEAVGLYFDGVRKGFDCECCGNRWPRATKWDEHPSVEAFESENPYLWDAYLLVPLEGEPELRDGPYKRE